MAAWEKVLSEISESAINQFISRELVTNPESLPLDNDAELLETHIIDSLSMLKLVLFIEQQFGVVVSFDEIVPANFRTINTICNYLRSKRKS